jgi:branched-chain amino acid transport system ATP-binding protein
MSEPLLVVTDLEVRYGEARALHRVSLSVPKGQLVAVVGANGAGKTTLIRAIAGMLRPSAGSIAFAGREIGGLNSHLVCEAGVGQVAEGRQVFPSLSVEENLKLGGMLRRSIARRPRNLERIYAMLPRLAERRRQRAGTLSGGEQQMLAIGRCLMAEPEFIMLDEPSLGLAPVMVEQMFALVSELKATGMTMLLVEQNVVESLELSDYAAVLENGEIVLTGTGTELINDDRVKTAYLGL